MSAEVRPLTSLREQRLRRTEGIFAARGYPTLCKPVAYGGGILLPRCVVPLEQHHFRKQVLQAAKIFCVMDTVRDVPDPLVRS